MVNNRNSSRGNNLNGGNGVLKKKFHSGHIVNGNQRFLILEAPNDENIKSYIEVLKNKKVSIVVRACQPTYSHQPIIDAGIRFTELPFSDGEPPSEEVVENWLTLVGEEFSKPNSSTVGVHCVAGLGRAPILVAIALIESGKRPLDAIDIIRKVRPKALNKNQMEYLSQYRPRKNFCAAGCVIS